VNAASRPRRHVRRAIGCFAVSVAAAIIGSVAFDHHVNGLSELAAGLFGVALASTAGMLVTAYATGVRIPRRARRLEAMSLAVRAGQVPSGRFQAGLRDLAPEGAWPTRWKRGRVLITPQSVVWAGRMTGRKRDLTHAQTTGSRSPDWPYRELTLRLPADYRGEHVRIMTLHLDRADLELAAPAALLEILQASIAKSSSSRGLPAQAGDRQDRGPVGAGRLQVGAGAAVEPEVHHAAFGRPGGDRDHRAAGGVTEGQGEPGRHRAGGARADRRQRQPVHQGRQLRHGGCRRDRHRGRVPRPGPGLRHRHDRDGGGDHRRGRA
jgi:hypothetical protein